MENYVEYTTHSIISLSLLSIMAPLLHPSSMDTFLDHCATRPTMASVLRKQNTQSQSSLYSCMLFGKISKMCM